MKPKNEAIASICNFEEMLPKGVNIKENSWQAKLAAKKLSTKNVAMVLGSTIHLWGVGANEFLASETWVKHELKHVEQFKQHGFVGFLGKYLWESIVHGYEENKFEIEAREAEGQ